MFHMHLVLHLIRFIAWLIRPLDHAVQDFGRALGAGDWPTTQGIVVSVAVEDHSYVWRATITYSYQANGEYYAGTTFRQFAYEKSALEYASDHPRYSAIIVRFRPARPDKSVVLKSDQVFMGEVRNI